MWPHDAHNVPDEPVVPWERKKYTGTKANPAASPRDFGEMETDRALDKPTEQLLSDVHEGLGEWRRFAAAQPQRVTRPTLSAEAFMATDLVLYALGRTASMQAVVARENQKTQKAIHGLTRWLVFFTVALLVLTSVLVCLDLRSPVSGTGPTSNGLPDAVGPNRTHDADDSERNTDQGEGLTDVVHPETEL
jgi:hypothetical protein